jgi:2Fe-2S ferredoxin
MARRDGHGLARRAMLTGEGFCWKRPAENRRFGKSLRRSSLRPLRAVLENPEAIMSKLTIVAFDGTRHELDVANGSTVMENAVRNSVPGIEAECGGACACATCHVYVDDAWSATVGPPEAMEEDMLDFAYEVRPTSRLSCQIKMSDALDGLVVHVPERQA